MSLTLLRKRDPINGGLARFREEMDRTFDRFFSEPLGFTEPRVLRAEGWAPPLDVSEADTEVTIRAEVPGIPVKDLEISVTGTTLSISGKKEEKEEKKGEDFSQCERRFGSFKRLVELPDTIDPDRIAAESDNGIVTIRIPKKPGAKPRLVEVRPLGKKIPVV